MPDRDGDRRVEAERDRGDRPGRSPRTPQQSRRGSPSEPGRDEHDRPDRDPADLRVARRPSRGGRARTSDAIDRIAQSAERDQPRDADQREALDRDRVRSGVVGARTGARRSARPSRSVRTAARHHRHRGDGQMPVGETQRQDASPSARTAGPTPRTAPSRAVPSGRLGGLTAEAPDRADHEHQPPAGVLRLSERDDQADDRERGGRRQERELADHRRDRERAVGEADEQQDRSDRDTSGAEQEQAPREPAPGRRCLGGLSR